MSPYSQLSVSAGGIEEAQISHIELSQVATGMWPTSAPVRASLALGVAVDAAVRVDELTTQQLCDCVSGVTICGLLHKPLMNAAARVLAKDVACLSQDQLCDVASAYARTGTNSPELFAHLTAAVHMHLEQRTLNAAQAAVLSWALSIHGNASSATISHLFNATVVRSLLQLFIVWSICINKLELSATFEIPLQFQPLKSAVFSRELSQLSGRKQQALYPILHPVEWRKVLCRRILPDSIAIHTCWDQAAPF